MYYRTCLLLIADEQEEIKEELDLIAAVKILNNFHVSMLPIQGNPYLLFIIINIVIYIS